MKEVNDIAYSHCDQRIASASRDCTVRLWCIRTRTSLRVFKGHTGSVRSVAFSPNDSKIVSRSRDKSVRIWNLQTGETEHVLEGHADSVFSVAYSASGNQIASGSWDKTAILWCSQTEQQLFRLNHPAPVCEIRFTPDGDELCSLPLDEDYFHSWNSHTGESVDRIKLGGGHVYMFLYFAEWLSHSRCWNRWMFANLVSWSSRLEAGTSIYGWGHIAHRLEAGLRLYVSIHCPRKAVAYLEALEERGPILSPVALGCRKPGSITRRYKDERH